MQAPKSWSPPIGVLGELTATALVRSRALHPEARELRRRAEARPAGDVPSFAQALRRPMVAVIAELKRRSPSKGVLDDSLDAAKVARAFAAGGAAAMSVLTEPTAFGGTLADLETASGATAIPLLRKDFIVDECQLFEARIAGASAALLIARALGPTGVMSLAASARAVGLETLVEVRSEDELDWAVAAGADAIGVNTRNLESLEIHPEVGLTLVPRIPPTVPGVYESGVRSSTDVEAAAAAGADAVLVGSVLSQSGGAEAAVRALTQVPRRGRG
ncbi:MAG: indole-3-glycerol-phosphate synthase [Gemmatimonadaceae bacterium]|nr:indole-3-glycerol-phosphate synthase [Gemmatimonadaceae bacterium]